MSYEEKLITTTIFLQPHHMGSSWRAHLEKAINDDMIGKCTVDHGYIIKVLNIHKILDQSITRVDGNIRFQLQLLAQILLPKIGEEFEATIELIFPHGVFCVHKMLRMIIPITRCHPFVIRQDFSNLHLHDPSSGRILRKDDPIRVVISDIRFENNFYSCIADLKT